MTHLSDGSSENSRALVTCMLKISQDGSGARDGTPPRLCGRERSYKSLTWETAEHDGRKNTVMELPDQSNEAVIRGWIGEAGVADQRRIGEPPAQVQRLQQARGAAAGAAAPLPTTNVLYTRLGKPPVFRGEETKWQEWYFKFGAYIMCSGDRYPELVTAVTRWDAEPGLVMLTEDAPLRIVQAVHDSNVAETLRLMY